MLMKKYFTGLFEKNVVLDLCAGKGGDLNKWKKLFISELFFIDQAINLVNFARKRYNSLVKTQSFSFPVTFFVADCFNLFLDKNLENDVWFSLASCQFATQYAFESEKRIRAMLLNITSRLKCGGQFIGTIPDANRIIKRWRKKHLNKQYFGNGLYEVRFECSFFEKINRYFSNEPFGLEYFFDLKDAIDHCPEYLIHFPTLVKIAKEYDLALLLEYSFYDFFLIEFDKPRNKNLIKRTELLEELKMISNKEWEVISLYKVFSFQKTIKNKKIVTRFSPVKKKIKEEEIIIIN